MDLADRHRGRSAADGCGIDRSERARPPAGGDPLAFFDCRLAALLDVLAGTDPATLAWNSA
ncbi:MAG: hypothetical protein WBL53_20465 [Pseudonocardiaceae bacterium]